MGLHVSTNSTTRVRDHYYSAEILSWLFYLRFWLWRRRWGTGSLEAVDIHREN
jgi:hypothetical protein